MRGQFKEKFANKSGSSGSILFPIKLIFPSLVFQLIHFLQNLALQVFLISADPGAHLRIESPNDRRGQDTGILRPVQRNGSDRSEEHTSELQSPDHLVCRLLLEKKKKSSTTL